MHPTPISCPTCGALAHPPRYADPDGSEKTIFVCGMAACIIVAIVIWVVVYNMAGGWPAGGGL